MIQYRSQWRFALLLAAVISTYSPAHSSPLRGGSIWLLTGGNILSIRSLNDFLAAQGMPELESINYVAGAGGHVFAERFVVGFEAAGITSQEYANTGYTSRLSGSYWAFHIGYSVYEYQGALIYPTISYGSAKTSVKVLNNAASTNEPVLSNDDGRSVFFDLAVTAEYAMPASEMSKNCFVIGARVGYSIPLSKKGWRTGFTGDLPAKVGFEGIYVRIFVGAGRFSVEYY